VQDLSERKQAEGALQTAEEQLRQSQRMDASGRLAGGVAHDFNNLLSIITGRSELLLARRDLADVVRRDVDLVHKAADRAASLTRQLLAFSRKQLLQPKVIDLNSVAANMGKMLRRLIGEHGDLVIVARRGTETVLVCEDEPDLRELAREVLEEYGYSVLEAKDGREALDVAAGYTDPIHLLLTDVVMPRMNGSELAGELARARQLKVLYMSGYTETSMMRGSMPDAA